MNSRKRSIANIIINEDRPTDLCFDDIYTWVIWQFPRKRGKWLCGAIRPPIASHSWLPALIKPAENIVQVHGYAERDFDSPQEALDWLIASKAG
ncbi:MAG TPA: hypothetical protein VFI27_18425 [candidate division Zixibacteria bacterium]|nr:hypothetical protein [candidate division Zixibacteria bacterium]